MFCGYSTWKANKTACLRFEQRSVIIIRYLLVEKCKPCENYGKICEENGEAYFSQKCLQID